SRGGLRMASDKRMPTAALLGTNINARHAITRSTARKRPTIKTISSPLTGSNLKAAGPPAGTAQKSHFRSSLSIADLHLPSRNLCYGSVRLVETLCIDSGYRVLA